MNDFQKPINRDEPAPYGQIRVNETQEDKKQREELYQGLPSSQKPFTFAILASFLKKFIDVLSFKKRADSLLVDYEQLFEDVTSFRKLLQILSHEDQSHNPEFTQDLSELWHNLIDDCNKIRGNPSDLPANFIKLKNFMTLISNYPPGADHNLGYYFAESAGLDWIPFPFMELLQSLHKECQTNPQKATLVQWIELLTEVLHIE